MKGLPEEDVFVATLRERGLRMTAERRVLLREVFAQHGHIDAAAILAAVRRRGHPISRATVYRNLELMVDCGLVLKQRLAGDRFCYEHLHAGQRHDHLVCRRCGRIVEFVSPAISALLVEICRAHRFAPAGNSLQIGGLCAVCASTGGTVAELSADA